MASAPPLLLVATRNAGKVSEIRDILCDVPVRLVSLIDYPAIPEINEDGATLRDNAFLKARGAFTATGLPSLSDDSGLEVDALGGEPGVRSARFAGENVTYEENNLKLLEMLRDTPAEGRTARFVCVCAFVDGGTEHMERGECAGRIAQSPIGGGGFGYDPLFIPEGGRDSFAMLSAAVKNDISHRGRAFQKMKAFLTAHFSTRG